MHFRPGWGLLLLGLAGPAWAADPAPDAAADGTAEASADAAAAATADAAPAADPGDAENPAAPASTDSAVPPPAGVDTARASALVITDREAELTQRLTHLAAADELQWLEADGRKFFAFRRQPPAGTPKGALLVVPAPRTYIDETALARRLRTWLPSGGFVTLAMQPPLGADRLAAPGEAQSSPGNAAAADDVDSAAGDATAEAPAAVDATVQTPVHADFCPRLAAALAALEAEQPPLIAIAAEGASVTAVLGCNAQGLPASVRALAAIGAWQGDWTSVTVPTIEFVPDLDPAAVRAADRRAARPREEGAATRRRVDLIGVDRRYDGAAEDIAKRLRGWLERLPSPPSGPAADATADSSAARSP